MNTNEPNRVTKKQGAIIVVGGALLFLITFYVLFAPPWRFVQSLGDSPLLHLVALIVARIPAVVSYWLASRHTKIKLNPLDYLLSCLPLLEGIPFAKLVGNRKKTN